MVIAGWGVGVEAELFVVNLTVRVEGVVEELGVAGPVGAVAAEGEAGEDGAEGCHCVVVVCK